MHVHGNHLSAQLPLELGNADRSIASQRAAGIRKKLAEKAAEAASGEAFEDLVVEEDGPERQAHDRWPSTQPTARTRTRDIAGEQETVESRTSIWA